ncbi:MAG TPA: tyrosine-protein phosphatase [Gemmataceae bacterium]|nr:tyrosine-protein phosphatase [Gemmataceae bacterium]
MTGTVVDAPAPPRPTGRRWPRALLRGGLAGLLLAVAVHALRTLVGGNFHVVVPGQVYRCAQPTGADLERLARDRGIRTVVNLRGCADPEPWYLAESRAAHRLGLSLEDVCLSATRLPSAHELRQLVEVLDRSERPILLHCYRGADRTGLASAMARLLYTDDTPAAALRHLGPRYGHFAVGRPAYLDLFFDLYAEWLAESGREHSPAAFRRWAVSEYCPGACRARLELIETPDYVVAGRPFVVRVRAHNTSVRPWRLKPGENAGIQAHFIVCDEQARPVAEGKAGLFNAEVPPGGSIDLALAVPALARPGRCRLVADLAQPGHSDFCQAGSEVLEWEFDVKGGP